MFFFQIEKAFFFDYIMNQPVNIRFLLRENFDPYIYRFFSAISQKNNRFLVQLKRVRWRINHGHPVRRGKDSCRHEIYNDNRQG